MHRIAISFFFFSGINAWTTSRPLTWPSRLGLQNTPTVSLQRGKTPQMSLVWFDLFVLMAYQPS